MTAPAQAEQPVAEPVWIQPDVLKYIRKEKERNACGVVYGTPSEHHTVPLYARPSAGARMGDGLERAAKEVVRIRSFHRNPDVQVVLDDCAQAIRALIPEVSGGAVQSNEQGESADDVLEQRSGLERERADTRPITGDDFAQSDSHPNAPLALLREIDQRNLREALRGGAGRLAVDGWNDLARILCDLEPIIAALAASGPEQRKGERRVIGFPGGSASHATDPRQFLLRDKLDRRQSAPRPERSFVPCSACDSQFTCVDKKACLQAVEAVKVRTLDHAIDRLKELLAPRPDTQPGEVVVPPSPLPWRMVIGDSDRVLGIQNAHGHFILRAGKDTREEVVAYIVATVNAAPSGRAG